MNAKARKFFYCVSTLAKLVYPWHIKAKSLIGCGVLWEIVLSWNTGSLLTLPGTASNIT